MLILSHYSGGGGWACKNLRLVADNHFILFKTMTDYILKEEREYFGPVSLSSQPLSPHLSPSLSLSFSLSLPPPPLSHSLSLPLSLSLPFSLSLSTSLPLSPSLPKNALSEAQRPAQTYHYFYSSRSTRWRRSERCQMTSGPVSGVTKRAVSRCRAPLQTIQPIALQHSISLILPGCCGTWPGRHSVTIES